MTTVRSHDGHDKDGSRTVRLTVDGEAIVVAAEVTVAAAVLGTGRRACRASVRTREPRGPVCGMGICFECRVTIDSEAHVRSCAVAVRDGMNVVTDAGRVDARIEVEATAAATKPIDADTPTSSVITTDVVVVGAGPAGLAAAASASQSGANVTVLDDNPDPGGQIWRRDVRTLSAGEAATRLGGIERDTIHRVFGAVVVDGHATNETVELFASTASGPRRIVAKTAILATGAQERFLPFPGWTLPGVTGAGGLQALVKGGLDVTGRRVVVAGSGPLLLAVADYLRRRGADVVAIVEQTTKARVMRFGAHLVFHPRKLAQAVQLKRRLRGIPVHYASYPVRAEADPDTGTLCGVTVRGANGDRHLPCDDLACGFGLVPQTRLAELLGCDVRDGRVTVGDYQRTSIPSVYAAGEITGVGGLDLSTTEGAIAGHAAARDEARAKTYFKKRIEEADFGRDLEKAFALRPELKAMVEGDTIVCRCEDVAFNAIRTKTNTRHAKLDTRCGMGPCQGRMCGPAMEFVLGWKSDVARPPLFPVELGMLGKTSSPTSTSKSTAKADVDHD